MEYMTDFVPLTTFQPHPQFEKYKYMALYELQRMHQFGYLHNDFHYDNVLIHPQYSYFGIQSGRAILIDFEYSSTIVQRQSPIELLHHELSGINASILPIFTSLDTQRNAFQSSSINHLEIRLQNKIEDIFRILIIYRGGTMNIPSTVKTPNYRKNEWTGLSLESFHKIMANDFEQTLKNADPKGFQLREESIQQILEEQKKDPKYFEKLVKAQFNNLLIDYND